MWFRIAKLTVGLSLATGLVIHLLLLRSGSLNIFFDEYASCSVTMVVCVWVNIINSQNSPNRLQHSPI